MLSGKRPFEAEYENALLSSIMNAEPDRITGLRTGVPIALERIINKCLAKSPDERYQHADELVVDLRSIHPTTTPATTGALSTILARGRWTRTRLILGIGAPIAWLWVHGSSLEENP
jgi:eukaryotic-like serine/threonine-protein kinase